MKDRTKIRTGKRIMAVILSLAMVFGIFSGMKLDAEAREGKIYKYEDIKRGMALYAGDIIDISTQNEGNAHWATVGIQICDVNGKTLLICRNDGAANHCKLDIVKDKDGVSYNTIHLHVRKIMVRIIVLVEKFMYHSA